jgi:hypothetical protein
MLSRSAYDGSRECHNIVLETLLVAWLQLEPEEIGTVFRKERVIPYRKPDGGQPVSLESQAVAFWACDILAKLVRECVPLAPKACFRYQPPDVCLSTSFTSWMHLLQVVGPPFCQSPISTVPETDEVHAPQAPCAGAISRG